MSAKLYVVGTPIGNLGDLSPRAAEVLEKCDFIAAEDTRVTVKLLNHLGIKKEMISYYEHNKRDRGEQILSRIANGEAIDARIEVFSAPSSTTWKCQLKLCITCTTVLHTRMIVAAFTMYALARSIIILNANLMLGAFHLGSSMMKKDFLYLYPVIPLMSRAPRKIRTSPRK